jgi:hypothetical protein
MQVSGLKSAELGTRASKPAEAKVLRFSVPFSTESKPEGSTADIRMAQ